MKNFELDREQYYEDLRKRQEEHLKRVKIVYDQGYPNQQFTPPWRPCMHDSCPECQGTGVRLDGSTCVHMISCPCPKCSPTFM